MNLTRLLSHRMLLTGLAWFAFGLTLARAQTSLPHAKVGQNYSFQVVTNPPAAAGTIYSASGLPGGLSINASSGLITGTPSVVGAYPGNIDLMAAGITNSLAYVLVVDAATGTPAITSPTSATATAGTAFTYATVATNSPLSFNISGLPPGLVANATTGAISGTPTTAGTYPVSLSANNASGTGSTVTLTLLVNPAASAPAITSAATVNGSAGAALNFTVTASNSPISFSISGALPVGVSFNPSTGVISGTPTVEGVYPVTVSAANNSGTGASAKLTITIGVVPTITTAAASANGTVGASFTYAVVANNNPTSFNLVSGTLPAGLTFASGAGVISGTPTTAGSSVLVVSANNATGTGPEATLTLTISGAPPVGGGGGGGGIIMPPSGGSAPSITTQPASASVDEGGSTTLSVVSTGSGLEYQWLKDGTAIAGASSASLAISNAKSSDQGVYTVRVSNSSGSVTSANATLTVVSIIVAPTITGQPTAQRVIAGSTATFTVTATGGGLSYQWRKDGAAVSGATNSTLSLPNATTSVAGNYTVVVTNSAGSATSNAAALTVVPRAAGAYFGTLGGSAGSFSLYIRSDLSAVFLGYARASKLVLISNAVTVDAEGHFRASVGGASPTTGTSSIDGRTVMAATTDYVVDGQVGSDGSVTGTVSGVNLSLAAPAPANSGTSASLIGFYQAGAAGTSATSYVVVGASGDAYVVTMNGAASDAGKGTVDASGKLSVTTEGNAKVAGTIEGASITVTATPPAGAAVTYIGANNEARTDVEKLFNVSTRSQTSGGGNVLIAGFVITGNQPKQVLVRAIGPTLSTFGVGGTLSAAHLEIYKGTSLLASGNDWSAGSNASAVANAAVQVGAFALANNSRDAALLVTLEPGAYTAMVTGQGGVSGVALVEAYDASAGSLSKAQRIVNISTRAIAGSGDNTLIAGFVVTGSVPKRVLIRGAGPSLAQFGLSGVLDRTQLAVYSGTKVIGQNTGWSTSPDAAAITSASAQVGAFAFASGSQDSAVILNLAPGAYTAQVSGVGATTGVALVEVYELP